MPFTAPYDAFQTLDGWVAIATASNKLFGKLCEVIGRSELAKDERFRSHRGRSTHRTEINAIVAEWVRARSCAEVTEALGPPGADLPCAVVARPDELLEDPQLLARDMIERHPHPTLGEVVFHGNPLKLSDTETREIALAPDLAQHNREVYGEIGLDNADLERLAAAGII